MSTIAPDSFFPYCVSASVLLQVLILPILGAIADYSHLRKRMLQAFATLGAIQTILLFLVTAPVWWLGGVLLRPCQKQTRKQDSVSRDGPSDFWFQDMELGIYHWR